MSDYMKKNIVLFIAVMLFISLSMKFNQSDIIWGTDKTLMTKAFVGTYSSEMDTFCHVIADPEAKYLIRLCLQKVQKIWYQNMKGSLKFKNDGVN